MAIIRNLKSGKLYGVAEEARRLGCSRPHLWMVVRGQRQSKKLMKLVKIKDV